MQANSWLVIAELCRVTKTKNNVMLTCPNDACKKVITKPLKTLNRQQGSKEPYYACTYCLTEITLTETEKDDTLEKPAADVAVLEEKPSQNQEKLSDCKHYFGYMSEKEHKQEMPEECMLCSRIIDCMIKKNGPTKEKTD
jgi:hypothetical protein